MTIKFIVASPVSTQH